MGNLLKLLSREPGATIKVDVFVDFENAAATEVEADVYMTVQNVLSQAPQVLHTLQTYRGATELIREAITNPKNSELQEKSWLAVCPLVGKMKMFYEYSLDLEKVVPELLLALCSGPLSPIEHLEQQQALAKQFAEILHFTLKFDDLKMSNPAIQNDFSYYRRTLSRKKMVNQDDYEDPFNVSSEMTNRMSLFYAEATPMLKMLSEVTTKFVSDHKSLPIENTTDCLSTMAALCKVMIENPDYYTRFNNEETLLFCLRVMVGVIILYDHVHPVGAFSKRSTIDMKGAIRVLKDQPPNKVEGLLNALRYTTKHLNDEATSKNIKSMLL